MKVSSKLAALKGLDARLREIRGYLDLVIEGTLPLNHEILYHLQVWLSIAICYM
jgi:26S proteasome regulatory subunit N8